MNIEACKKCHRIMFLKDDGLCEECGLNSPHPDPLSQGEREKKNEGEEEDKENA